jgi:isocitrate dehydrogenase
MSNNAQSIQRRDGKFIVPDHPIIPFIEGDGTGPDIWRASVRVFDAAVSKAYAARARSSGSKCSPARKRSRKRGTGFPKTRSRRSARTSWVSKDRSPRRSAVGIRSLNVALRQELDLYVCLRPVRYFSGMETPVKRPDLVNMVIFRENTEDIYAGIEFQEGTAEVEQFKKLFAEAFPKLYKKVRFPNSAGIGVKPISREGSERLIRAAIDYALANNRKSLTLVHKGNIMKFTEGAFRDWGYELVKREYGATEFDGGPWCKLPGGLVIKDVIADAFLSRS